MLLSCVDFIKRVFGCSLDDAVASFLPCLKKELPDDVLSKYSFGSFASKVFYSYSKANYYVVFFDGKRNHFYKCINSDLKLF